MTDNGDDIRARDDWGVADPGLVARVVAALDAGDAKTARALTRDLHAADLADVIERGGGLLAVDHVNLPDVPS